MMARNFRLAVYDFESAEGFALGADGFYFAFASEDIFAITANGTRETIPVGEGRFLPSSAVLAGKAWLFALTRIETSHLPVSIASLELSADLALDEDIPQILRADAVTSAAGAQTPRHGHRGPGIRRLLKELLLAEVGECTKRIRAGDAWFESGKEWVVGSNISESDNSFVRVMILPAELKGGQSSFVPASPEEASKPRAAKYRLFGEVDFLPLVKG